MSRLSVYHQNLPGHPDKVLCHAEDIARTLAPLGVLLEGVARIAGLRLDGDEAQLLAACAPLLVGCPERVDVTLLRAPQAPAERAAARAAWLEERACAGEVAFVQLLGRSLLTLHLGEQVLELLLEPGERVRLPAGCGHWLDWGERPEALLLRLASEAGEGQPSGDPLPTHFNRLDDC